MEQAFEQWKSKEVARLLALVETERRYYQEMVANLPVSMAVVNSQGYLVGANRNFRQTFVSKTEDWRKLRLDQIFISAELQARISSVFESGVASRPLVVDRAVEGGAPQRLRLSIQPVRDWDEESSLQALVAVEDLSEPTAPQAILPVIGAPITDAAPTEARLPESLPCVLWTARVADRVFTMVSASSRLVLGLNGEDWLHSASAFVDRIEPQDRTSILEFYDRIQHLPGIHSCDFRMSHSPGSWYRETVLIEVGAVEFNGVITIVTARRAIEEQTLQTQRIEALASLAGRLAHEINNPLMIVNGYAEDLGASLPASDSRAGDVREIQAAGKRIGELTANLQSITRKHALPPVPVDVASELAKVVDRMRAAAGEYLKVEFVGLAESLAVLADPAQLHAIILELAAVLVEGGHEAAHLGISADLVRISELLRPGQVLKPGDYVAISIVNKNASAAQPPARLFESWLPGKEPGREQGPALVKALKTVEEWGGTIQAQPGSNEIRLYFRQAPGMPPPTVPEPTPEMPKAPPEQAKKTRILVVEDEPGLRALVRKILQREGYEIFEAPGGAEALEILKDKGPVNLLITDVMMDGMSGRELATAVHALNPNCGVLYISGFTAGTGVETGQFPPNSQFLQKPFTLGSLLRKVSEVLSTLKP